ncbi:amidohydrolase [Glutamicibacter sp. NPDC087344]|uniref:amidohydrolase n=1 Tax=Glutamicibacter sp. NPDC087344 TaxID=3363994 RepID=UPI00380DF3D5
MSQQQPQMIIHSGIVAAIGLDPTLDAAACQGRPSAVAVHDGRILAVGGNELLDLAGEATTLIDAQGGAILPGINDGHLHFAASAVIRHEHLDLKTAASWDEVIDRLEAAQADDSGWIRASGWDQAALGSEGIQRMFTAGGDTPVVAFDASGHQVMINAAALSVLELHVPAPVPGGVISRSADGTPSGLFIDAAMRLVNDALPGFSQAALRRAFTAHQHELHALGLTSLTEPGLGPGGRTLMGAVCDEQALKLMAQLSRDGELSLRINVLLLFSGTGGESAAAVTAGLASELPRTTRGIDPLKLRVAGVKVFADGIPRSGTAWFHDDYQLPCGHGHGALVLTGADDEAKVAEFRQIIAAIDAAGLQAGVHVTGDAATEALIEAVEALPDADRARANRHYIIHGAFAENSLLERLAAAGIGYSTNPSIRAEAGALMQGLLGAERFAAQQPLASAAACGVDASLASDAPVTSPDWRRSVVAAVTRDTTAGPGDGQPERLTLAQALAMMTQTPARQDHAEEHKGKIQPGYLADVCILRDPLDADVKNLITNPTSCTIVNGDVVYSAT